MTSVKTEFKWSGGTSGATTMHLRRLFAKSQPLRQLQRRQFWFSSWLLYKQGFATHRQLWNTRHREHRRSHLDRVERTTKHTATGTMGTGRARLFPMWPTIRL